METIVKEFREFSPDELYDILKSRVDIFMLEQRCLYEELDNIDKQAIHICIRDPDLKAYCRIIRKDNYAIIGRVLSIDREKGYGKAVMEKAIDVCREQGYNLIEIEAQSYAKQFYEKLGFIQTSDEFDLDGIKHIKMELKMVN